MSRFFNPGLLIITLLRKILFLWVRTEIKGSNQEELCLDPNKPVCYVLQYSSLSARLVLEHACISEGLPSANQQLKIEDKAFRRSFIFLYERKGKWLKTRQTPTVTEDLKQMVYDISEDESLDIQVVPVSLFWGRSPVKEKSWLKLLLTEGWSVPGVLKQFLIILLHGRRTYVQFNQAMSLQKIYQESNNDAPRGARKAARILRVHFRRVRQTVLGPNLSHRHNLVRSIIDSSDIKARINEHAEKENISIEKAQRLALKYGDEIASNLQISTIIFLEKILSKLWNKIYNGIITNNLDVVRETTKDHAVVYTPCHRSHIDYLLLSSLLFGEGIMVPHIAAGINLNLPVVGPILRRGGAFFMRRSFKDNPLYSAIFSEYIHTIFKKGYSVEYFVEGGRSRTGRTLQPRAGMVAMTVNSYLRDQQKPIAFVPVYFGYEKVLEGNSYQGELRGKEKKQESVFGLFKSLKNLRRSFGKVSVNFGDPIFLKDYLDQQKPNWKQTIGTQDQKPEWLPAVVDNLSTEIVTRINASAAINPINMTALVLLSTERHAMDSKVLANLMNSFSSMLQSFPYSDTMTFAEGDGASWIQYTESMHFVDRLQHTTGDIITLSNHNAVSLTYNRNTILHFFAVPSLIACLLHNNISMEKQKVHEIFRDIYPYIRSELFLQWDSHDIDEIFEGWLDILIENKLLREDDGLIVRPAIGSDEFVQLTILSRFIIQTLERYYISVAILMQEGSGQIDASQLEKQSTQMAERMSILFGLNAPEFFDKALFRNFISKLQEKNVVTKNADEKLEFGQQIERISEDARLVLNSELRQAIMQVTGLS